MKKGFSKSDIPPLQHNNIVYYLPEDKAELFNKYFTDNSKITGEDGDLPELIVQDLTIPPLTITKEMVADVIKNQS